MVSNEKENNQRHNTDIVSATLVSPPVIRREEQQHQIAGQNAEEDILPVAVLLPPKMFYWNSQDASNLFGIKLDCPGEDVKNSLML
jgi:hypothetical protein